MAASEPKFGEVYGGFSASRFLVFGLVSVSTGCSNYVTERVIPTGCIETTYYLDADQDGWAHS